MVCIYRSARRRWRKAPFVTKRTLVQGSKELIGTSPSTAIFQQKLRCLESRWTTGLRKDLASITDIYVLDLNTNMQNPSDFNIKSVSALYLICTYPVNTRVFFKRLEQKKYFKGTQQPLLRMEYKKKKCWASATSALPLVVRGLQGTTRDTEAALVIPVFGLTLDVALQSSSAESGQRTWRWQRLQDQPKIQSQWSLVKKRKQYDQYFTCTCRKFPSTHSMGLRIPKNLASYSWLAKWEE